ncbi:hypothetical protein BK025_09070 [Sodalis sp. TME1]|nr:hypothetical protein BK025_09070 [Sodalis sp. TME1]
MATTPIQTSPVVTIADGHAVTTSIAVAEYFQKPHKDVLAKIARLECSAEFTERNFSPSEYTDSTGRQLPCYQITRDGFAFLAMGFTGKRAARFKEAYISEFNRLEATLHGTPQALPNDQKNAVASRIMLAFDYTGKILFTEDVPADAFVGDINKFRWFAGKLGYLMFKENELLEMLKGGSKQ